MHGLPAGLWAGLLHKVLNSTWAAVAFSQIRRSCAAHASRSQSRRGICAQPTAAILNSGVVRSASAHGSPSCVSAAFPRKELRPEGPGQGLCETVRDLIELPGAVTFPGCPGQGGRCRRNCTHWDFYVLSSWLVNMHYQRRFRVHGLPAGLWAGLLYKVLISTWAAAAFSQMWRSCAAVASRSQSRRASAHSPPPPS